MIAQAKPISEVVKDFEQSLENLQPSTRRVYVAGARASAELGDSKTRKADALREKSLHRNPARLGADRRAMRGACQRNASKMARKLPQNRGPRSASVGSGNRGTMLRSSLALLACLERAAGPARPTAALPQISRVEPITTPFPRAQRRRLGPGSPAQRSAATQRGGGAQQHRAHHSGEDQSRFPLWRSLSIEGSGPGTNSLPAQLS